MDAILLVEDEDTLRRSQARGLARGQRWEIVEAATVAAARAAIAARTPRLVITDFDLPDGTGLEVVAALDAAGLRVPVVFVSAYVAKFRGRLPPGGDFEVYEKPVPLERLRAIVEDRLSAEPPPSPFTVTDYVQLAGMGGHTVAIEVTSVGGRGRIVVRGGQVWSAADERGSGLEAFRRLAFLAAPSIRVRALDDAVASGALGPQEFRGSVESVLLEAARLLDEQRRDEPAQELPPSAAQAPTRRPPPLRPTAPPPPRPSAQPETAREMSHPRPSAQPVPSRPPPAGRPRGERPAGVRLAFDTLYERGVEALLQRDFAAAASHFAEAAELDPSDGRVRANRKRLAAMGYP